MSDDTETLAEVLAEAMFDEFYPAVVRSVTDAAAPRIAARIVQARAGEELAMVCDAYGLPRSAVALARHIENNAAATIENWKAVAEARAGEGALRERIAALRDEWAADAHPEDDVYDPGADPGWFADALDAALTDTAGG